MSKCRKKTCFGAHSKSKCSWIGFKESSDRLHQLTWGGHTRHSQQAWAFRCQGKTECTKGLWSHPNFDDSYASALYFGLPLLTATLGFYYSSSNRIYSPILIGCLFKEQIEIILSCLISVAKALIDPMSRARSLWQKLANDIASFFQFSVICKAARSYDET